MPSTAFGFGFSHPFERALSAITTYLFGPSAVPAGWTHARTSTSTVVGSNGLIQTVASGQPAFTYSPNIASDGSTYTVSEVLGAEKITATADREFSSNTGYWTLGPGVSIGGGTANYTAAVDGVALSVLASTAGITSGLIYRVVFTVTARTLGGVRVSIGGAFGSTYTATGTYSEIITAAAGSLVGVYAVGATTLSIDNISIKEEQPQINGGKTPRHLGQRVEAQATQIFKATRVISGAQWVLSNCTATDGAGIGQWGDAGMAQLTTPTTAVNSLSQALTAAAPATGSIAIRFAVRAGAVTTASFGILSAVTTWAQTSGSFRIIRGPGVVVTQSGALLNVSGLSTTETTVIEQIRTGFGGIASFVFYPRGSSTGNAGDTMFIEPLLAVDGAVISSTIANFTGTGTVVRDRDSLMHNTLSTLFPSGLTRNTMVLRFRAQSMAANSTIASISAGGTFGAGNGMFIRHLPGAGVQVGGVATGVATGNAVTADGATLNTVAVSWDTTSTTMVASLNGGTVVSLGTLDFTGTGSTHFNWRSLVNGSDSQGHPSLVIAENGLTIIPGAYTTGAALQALSA